MELSDKIKYRIVNACYTTNSKFDCAEMVAKELVTQINELLETLKQINQEEMNGMRPGGSPSRSATLSYEILKKYKSI